MKNFIYIDPLKDNSIVACQGVLNMNLDPNGPKEVALHSNSNTTYKHAPQVERNYSCCIQNNQ
jgi:hypothetical protein